MSFSWVFLVTVSFHFVLATTENSEELFVTEDRSLKKGLSRVLTCISKNDDAALIWNYDLSAHAITHHFHNFEPLKPVKKKGRDCAICKSQKCSVSWSKKEGWTVVSSLKYPMAPVVDYRWEGFTEYIPNQAPGKQEFQNALTINSPDGTLVFSIRGTRDIEIRLSMNNTTARSSYVLIKIATKGTNSVIESCSDEQLSDRRHVEPRNCEEIDNISHKAAILEAFEWRTFRLQWIGHEDMIKLFHDTDKNAFLQGRVKPWHSVSEILVKSYAAARFKFHNYNYSLATIPNAVLTTREFDHLERNFCIHMLVSLCPECQLIVILTESKNGKVVVNMTIPGNKDFYLNGLRTWRSIELKFNLLISPPTRIRFVVTTILNKLDRKNIWWALDNIYFCEGTELSSRKSTIELPISDPNNETPNIKCQKLIHNKILVTGLSPSEPTNSRNRTHPISRPTSSYSFGFTTSRNFNRALTNGRWYRDVIEKNENACLDLVTGQTYIKLVRNSNSQACGNYRGTLTGNLEEKENAKNKQDFACPSLQCTIGRDLKLYTEYNVIVKLRDGSTVLIKTVRTLEPAPGMIRNLRLESVFAGNVTGKWEHPDAVIGTIRYYTVTIKRIKLRGCADYGKETPPVPEKRQNVTKEMAFFTGLHPYAEYDFIVVANTVEPGPSMSIKFETKELDTPTTNVSILRLIDGESHLAWEGLEDCTLITSSTKLVRLSFTGVSDWVQDENFTIDVQNKKYDFKNRPLRPFTKYRVRAYYVRPNKPVNENNYQELFWRTAPSAPPAVEGLMLYDADAEKNTISVKCKPPYPANGEIESYNLTIIKRSPVVRRWVTDVTNLNTKCSSSHVCFENLILPSNEGLNTELELQIFAKNVNVSANGAETLKKFNPNDLFNEVPSKPEYLWQVQRNYGIVILEWYYPQFTRTKIVGLRIKFEGSYRNMINYHSRMDRKEIDYPFVRDENICSTELNLEPSTDYLVHIRAVNRNNRTSEVVAKMIRVSESISFASGNKLSVECSESEIEIKVPALLNGTRRTVAILSVEGPSMCRGNVSTDLLSSQNETKLAMNWIAGKYQVKDNEPFKFIFDVNELYGVNRCSFQQNETYKFSIVLRDPYYGISAPFRSDPFTLICEKRSQESSKIWLIIIPIVIICLLLLLIWYSKREKIWSKLLNNLPLICSMRSSNNSSCTVERIMSQIEVGEHSVSTDEQESDLVLRNLNFEPVKVNKFEEYVKGAVESRLLESQWEILSGSLIRSCRYGYLPENRPKNRCNGAIPYDDNRVRLKKLPNEPYSDYINASYIQGHRKAEAYIAAQGPKRDEKTNTDTVPDFWRMVRQKNVQVICMLTNVMENGKKKCEQYWPEVGKNVEYGEAFILNMEHQVFVDYTIRTLQLICPDGRREIKHFHFTGWPEHGVPKFTQSLAGFMKKLLATPIGKGPMIVHGCAGVGRTGTLILCDICLRQAVREKIINIPKVTFEMRQDRANMVETVQQYLLAHLIIAECKILELTQIPCSNRLKEKILKLRKQLPSDIQRLSRIVWQDKALHSLAPEPTTEDIAASHRLWQSDHDYSNPAEITLPSAPDTRSGCLNVTSVEGVLRKDQYLAVQLPPLSNLPDLLNLVLEKEVELIVVLQRTNDTEDPTYYNVIPNKPGSFPLPNIQVGTESTLENEEYFTSEKLSLTNISKDEPRVQPITILTCTKWPDQADAPPPPVEVLVSLWMASEKIHRKESPTLVICRDGVTGCGLYLALSFLLERMSLEGVCDVISAVRAIKRSRSDFVQSLNQFEYLYDAALNYNEHFDMYANFS